MEEDMQEVEEVEEVEEENKLKAFVSCDYDEFDPSSYRGIRVRVESETEGENVKFKSKSPQKDKNDAVEYARKRNAEIYISSSWHNFISDALREVVK